MYVYPPNGECLEWPVHGYTCIGELRYKLEKHYKVKEFHELKLYSGCQEICDDESDLAAAGLSEGMNVVAVVQRSARKVLDVIRTSIVMEKALLSYEELHTELICRELLLSERRWLPEDDQKQLHRALLTLGESNMVDLAPKHLDMLFDYIVDWKLYTRYPHLEDALVKALAEHACRDPEKFVERLVEILEKYEGYVGGQLGVCRVLEMIESQRPGILRGDPIKRLITVVTNFLSPPLILPARYILDEMRWKLKSATPAVLLFCKVCDSAATPLLRKLCLVIDEAPEFQALFSRIKTALGQIGIHDDLAAEEEFPDSDGSEF